MLRKHELLVDRAVILRYTHQKVCSVLKVYTHSTCETILVFECPSM